MDAWWHNSITWIHDDVIKWKHFLRNWPFVRGIHRWIPRTKASNAKLWCFHWSACEYTIEKTIAKLVIWDAISIIMTSALCNAVLTFVCSCCIQPRVIAQKMFKKWINMIFLTNAHLNYNYFSQRPMSKLLAMIPTLRVNWATILWVGVNILE